MKGVRWFGVALSALMPGFKGFGGLEKLGCNLYVFAESLLLAQNPSLFLSRDVTLRKHFFKVTFFKKKCHFSFDEFLEIVIFA